MSELFKQGKISANSEAQAFEDKRQQRQAYSLLMQFATQHGQPVHVDWVGEKLVEYTVEDFLRVNGTSRDFDFCGLHGVMKLEDLEIDDEHNPTFAWYTVFNEVGVAKTGPENIVAELSIAFDPIRQANGSWFRDGTIQVSTRFHADGSMSTCPYEMNQDTQDYPEPRFADLAPYDDADRKDLEMLIGALQNAKPFTIGESLL